MHHHRISVNLESSKVPVALKIPCTTRCRAFIEGGNTQRTLSPWESFRPRQASRLAGHSSFLMDERKEPIQQQEHLSAHDQNSVQIHQPPATGLKQPVTGEQNDQQQSENPGAG